MKCKKIENHDNSSDDKLLSLRVLCSTIFPNHTKEGQVVSYAFNKVMSQLLFPEGVNDPSKDEFVKFLLSLKDTVVT